MITLHTTRKLRFSTTETTTEWRVYAILIEEVGGIVHLSEPRLVKIIPKTQQQLTGTVQRFILAAPRASQATHSLVRSPYTQSIGYFNTDVLAWYGPQPPTK